MRTETRAFVGVGSNLGARGSHIEFARVLLCRTTGIRGVRLSPLYRSTAIGPGVQPDYLNGVFEVQTTLAPETLLARLQEIEAAAGRLRDERWGARTLDLDLLVFGACRRAEQGLCVPHARLKERNFVVYPLFDLAPELRLPDGTALADLRSALPTVGLLPATGPESCDAGA